VIGEQDGHVESVHNAGIMSLSTTTVTYYHIGNLNLRVHVFVKIQEKEGYFSVNMDLIRGKIMVIIVQTFKWL